MLTKIACIGSRDTPDEILDEMFVLGAWIVSQGGQVATGNAKGADQAFARGGNSVDPTKVRLYLPWTGYEADAIVEGNQIAGKDPSTGNIPYYFPRWMERLAEKHHPAWPRLSQGARKLMCRNAGIIQDSALVIAYLNHDRTGGGGTGHGWRIATAQKIPRVDLAKEHDIEEIKETIKRKVSGITEQ